MSEFLQVMTLPFLACVILTGMHAYLGMHVIERQVIFVDLALAQIAALGAGVALLLGHDGHDAAAYGLSLGFTIAGAAVFSLTRFKKPKVPQEAVIGIVYAVAAAALVLVLSRSGEGDEHIRQMLVGNILLVDRWEVLKMLLIYSAVGVLHFLFRGPLFRISRDPDRCFREGTAVRAWDFFFYATFGVVVTCSVHLAGVLLVFAFLIVPACAAALFSDDPRTRLFTGWGIGLLASVLGMSVSYFMDLPTGASVVCTFGGLLACAALIRLLTKRI